MTNSRFVVTVALMALLISAGAALLAFDGEGSELNDDQFEIDNLIYTIIDGTDDVKVSGKPRTYYEDSLTIPSEVEFEGKKYNVTTIATHAFVDNDFDGRGGGCALIIENGVEYVEGDLFNPGSTNINISSIAFPDSVVSVGERAFRHVSFTPTYELEIGPNLSFIGEAAFGGVGCKNIKVDSDNPNYKDIDGILYNKDGTFLMSVPKKHDFDGFAIQDTVEYIDAYAATGIGSFRSPVDLIVPSNVVQIGESAFFGSVLKHISFAENSHLKVICQAAFSNIKVTTEEGLGEICFPDSLKIIEENAFSISPIKSLVFNEGLEYIGNAAFSSIDFLETISLSSTIKFIGGRAFNGTSLSMDEIVFPIDLEYLGGAAFENSSVKSEIKIVFGEKEPVLSNKSLAFSKGSDVVITLTAGEWATETVLNEYALGEKTSIDGFETEPVILNDGKFTYVSYDGETALLTDVVNGAAPVNNPTIGGFVNDTNGKSYKIIGTFTKGALENDKVIGDVKFLSTIKFVGAKLFGVNHGITSVVFEEGVELIGYDAFTHCNNLKTVTIPDSVKIIEEDAFLIQGEAGERMLKSVTIGNGVKIIGKEAFMGWTNLESVKIGSSVEYIGECAFAENALKEDLILPESLSFVGTSAFSGQYTMKKVEFKGQCPAIGSFVFDRDISGLENTDYGLKIVTPGWNSPTVFDRMFGSNVFYDVEVSKRDISLPAFIVVSVIIALILIAAIVTYVRK